MERLYQQIAQAIDPEPRRLRPKGNRRKWIVAGIVALLGLCLLPLLLPSRETSLIGIWEQRTQQQSNQWLYLSKIEVTRAEGKLQLRILDQASTDDYARIHELQHIDYNGKTWHIQCTYGNGAQGRFELTRRSDTVFDGLLKTTDPRDPKFYQQFRRSK